MRTEETTNIFEQASRIKLRIPSSKGNLTVEDLWDLPLRRKNPKDGDEYSLNELAKKYSNLIKAEESTDFVNLDGINPEPEHDAQTKKNELIFSILLAVINTRVAEIKEKEAELVKEQTNAKILRLISEKKDAELKQASVEELEKLLIK